jgi:hypothetical protein
MSTSKMKKSNTQTKSTASSTASSNQTDGTNANNNSGGACPKCKRNFKHKSSLVRHLKESSSCSDPPSATTTIAVMQCAFCQSFDTKSKSAMDRHFEKCVPKKDAVIVELKRDLELNRLEADVKQRDSQETIADLKIENAFLKGKIEGLTAMPTVAPMVNHNKPPTSNGTSRKKGGNDRKPPLLPAAPLTRQRIDEFLAKGLYTFELYDQGVVGLVSFFDLVMGGDGSMPGAISDGAGDDDDVDDDVDTRTPPSQPSQHSDGVVRNYRCNDVHRKKYSRFTGGTELTGGQWVVDKDGEFILQNLYDALRESGVIDKYREKIMKDRSDLEKRNNAIDRTNLVTLGVDDVGASQANRMKLHRHFMRVLSKILVG